MRSPVFGQVLLRERREGVVQLAARLGGDGVEHQRRLARTRHARHHGDLSLGNADADMLQVVLCRIAHYDMVESVAMFHSFFSQAGQNGHWLLQPLYVSYCQ